MSRKAKLVFVHVIEEGIVGVWQSPCLCSPPALESYVYDSHMCVYGGSYWIEDHNKRFWRCDGPYRSLYKIRKDLPLCSTWEEVEVFLELYDEPCD
jgi:hypothetical protein